jgi:peptidoglycan/LPS O-acetylase OafA/YrhL
VTAELAATELPDQCFTTADGTRTDRRPRLSHRPELDGLRGIAVLVVLASHARVLGVAREGGGAGVTLFFVLSGYLITRLLAAEWAATTRLHLQVFYLRRALRLFPALGAVLIAVVAGYGLGLWPANRVDLAIALPAVMLYVGNWVAAAGANFGVLGHTWSLAVEEQFYLVWPLLLVVALPRTSLRSLGILAVLAAVLVTPWRAVLLLNGNLGWAFNGTDAHADGLLLGCAIALLSARLPTILGWLGIGGVVVTSIAWIGGGGLVIMVPLATIASAMALAGAPPMLGWKPLAFVGRISYGLYLWHFLFIWSGFPAIVVIGAAFAAAIASFHLIESPFLRMKDRLAPESNAASS